MRWLIALGILVLVGCSDRTAAPVVPGALSVGENRAVFIGTTRAVNAAGEFGIGRAPALTLLETTVSIPPDREIGSLSDGLDRPRPERDFVLAAQTAHAERSSFARALRQEIDRSGDVRREVTLFIHGFNNSYSDAAFRIAQLAHDLDVPGALVSYAWPSRGNPLGYEYDRDSALFARDGLAELFRTIQQAGDPDIVVVAHSMGANVLMETLRQFEIADPGWSSRSLSGVILLSPDVNIDVFRSQLARFDTVPDPFVVIVSRKDAILRLSARLRGEKAQLGNIANADEVGDLPITVLDVSAFTDRRSGNHFVAGGSPALIQLIRQASELDREFLRGRNANAVRLPGQRRVLTRATEIEVTPIPSDQR